MTDFSTTPADGELHPDTEGWVTGFTTSPIGVDYIAENIRREARQGQAGIHIHVSCAFALTKLAAEAIEARRLRSTPLVISREGAGAPDLRAALRHIESPTELLNILVTCAQALDGGPRQALCDVDLLIALASYADEALRAHRRAEEARHG